MEDRLTDVLFSDPFPKKRSDHESRKSGFRFHLKNPLGVWILWIHDPFLDLSKKKNTNSVFGFKNPDSDFPPKKAPSSCGFGVAHVMFGSESLRCVFRPRQRYSMFSLFWALMYCITREEIRQFWSFWTLRKKCLISVNGKPKRQLVYFRVSYILLLEMSDVSSSFKRTANNPRRFDKPSQLNDRIWKTVNGLNPGVIS